MKDSSHHELDDPPTDLISSVKFSPTGDSIAVASWDRLVHIYTRLYDGPQPYKLAWRLRMKAPILDACWSQDEGAIVTVGVDRTVRVVMLDGSDDPTLEPQILSEHHLPSNNVAISKDNELLISTSWDGTMHVHSLQGKGMVRIRLAAKPYALALSENRVVVAMAARKVSVYDLDALKQLLEESGDSKEILEVKPWQERESQMKLMPRALACLPDGSAFVTSSIEGRVSVEWFDENLQERTYAFKCHRQKGPSVDEDWKPDGNPEDMEYVYPVNALAFHPVYGTFATGGGDGVVSIWDAQTKKRVKQYQGLGDSVNAVDFSPDGKFMAVGVCPGWNDIQEPQIIDPKQVAVIVKELAPGEVQSKEAKAKTHKADKSAKG